MSLFCLWIRQLLTLFQIDNITAGYTTFFPDSGFQTVLNEYQGAVYQQVSRYSYSLLISPDVSSIGCIWTIPSAEHRLRWRLDDRRVRM